MKGIKGLITGLGTIITYLFGGWDTALEVLVVLMVLDYTTGVLKGVIKKELSSRVGYKGLARKALIFIVLIVANMLDRVIKTENFLFRTVMCCFYIANESLSILENCVALELPIPVFVKDKLIQIRDLMDKGGK